MAENNERAEPRHIRDVLLDEAISHLNRARRSALAILRRRFTDEKKDASA